MIAAALLATVHAETGSADEMRTETIKFAAGASEASVSGLVKGYDSVDYLVSAEAGQTMVVGMTTDNASSYFNILAPGESDVAFYVGSTGGNNYSGSLPLSGEYKVRVYLMRNAARRNETANYTLDVMIALCGLCRRPAGRTGLLGGDRRCRERPAQHPQRTLDQRPDRGEGEQRRGVAQYGLQDEFRAALVPGADRRRRSRHWLGGGQLSDRRQLQAGTVGLPPNRRHARKMSNLQPVQTGPC